MSNSGRKKNRLVAEKRYSASKPKKKPAKAKPARRKATARKAPARKGLLSLPMRLVRWVLRLIWKITWRIGAVVALIVGVAVAYTFTTLPPVGDLLDGRSRGSVTLLDRNGDVYAWRGDQFGGVVTADTVSPALKNAVVATEDKRFYYHLG
ncbi:MAG: glycosyl transferase, partial [Roseovarius gahaiensis]